MILKYTLENNRTGEKKETIIEYQESLVEVLRVGTAHCNMYLGHVKFAGVWTIIKIELGGNY